MTWISAVKVLQLDQRYKDSYSTEDIDNAITDPTATQFNYDKSLDVLVALFVQSEKASVIT